MCRRKTFQYDAHRQEIISVGTYDTGAAAVVAAVVALVDVVADGALNNLPAVM